VVVVVLVVSGGRDGGGGEDGGSGESEGEDAHVHGLCAAVRRVVRCLVGAVPILIERKARCTTLSHRGAP
jgi:hypothetical protein